MFERYSEPARRLMFLARNHAVRARSSYIEPEHLVLALLEDAAVLRQLLPPAALAELSATLSGKPGDGNASPAGPNLPLSASAKTALSQGADCAKDMGSQIIGRKHLLLGILRNQESAAVGLLAARGITAERVSAETDIDLSVPVTREALHQLVETLPEGALEPTLNVLRGFHEWPPARPALPDRIAQLETGIRQRFNLRTGTGTVSSTRGTWRSDADGKLRDGSFSSSGLGDGAKVTETHRFIDGHEITIIEHLRVTDGGTKLSWRQEVQGPGQERKFQIDFDVPKS